MPGTVLSMQNILLGQIKVMQIRQRETLSHQRAIIHEVNFLDSEGLQGTNMKALNPFNSKLNLFGDFSSLWGVQGTL